MAGLPPHPEHLRIFPSAAAAAQAVAPAPGACVATSGHVTFASLFASLGSPGGQCFASDLVGRILVRSLLLHSDPPLRGMAQEPWGVRAVHQSLMEIRQAGMTAAHFAGKVPPEALRPLVALLGAYQARLEQARLFDGADRERHAVLAVSRGEVPPELAQVRRVTVEGVGSLFGARLDLLSAWCARGARVSVRLPFDGQRPAAFAWPLASLHRLEQLGRDHLDVDHDARVGSGPLRQLRATQFTAGTAPGANARVVQLPQTREHGRYVAHAVGRWLRQGVAPHEVAIVAADPDQLSDTLCTALEEVGLWGYRRRGRKLSRCPPARSLLQALRLPDQGFPREDFLEVWAQLGRSVDTPSGSRSPDWVAETLRRSGARREQLTPFGESLRRQAERDRWRHSEAPGEAAAVAAAIEELLGQLAPLPDQAPVDQQVARIEALVADLGAAFGFVSEGSVHASTVSVPVSVPGLLRAQAERHEGARAITDLLMGLRQAARVAGAEEPWSRQEVIDTLELLIGEHRLPPRGLPSGAIAVHTPEDLLGTEYRCLVLAGVDAGVFPRAERPDPVLTDELRADLNRLFGGPRLLQRGAATGRDTLHSDARHRWLWLEALASCQEQLLVTMSTPDGGGSEQGQSDFVVELCRSLEIEPHLPDPLFANDTALTIPVATERWAFNLSREARLVKPDSLPRAAALGQELGKREPDRLRHVTQRVALERARAMGAVDGPSPLAADRKRLTQYYLTRTHSTTSLDALGVCAFRHFAGWLLRLSRSELPTLGADPREQGSAAHGALSVVYSDLVNRGGLRAARERPAEARDRARQVFNSNTDEILREVNVHPWLQDVALDDAWAAVERQLAYDLDSASEFEPVALEYAFSDLDDDADPPLSIPDPEGRRILKVRGSIDRVDQSADALLVRDYKRSKPKRDPGRHFQLPIYAAAALREWGKQVTRFDAEWVSLRGRWRSTKAEDVTGEPAAFPGQLSKGLWGRVDRVLAGDISPDPAPAGACQQCDFSSLCRYRAVTSEAEDDPS